MPKILVAEDSASDRIILQSMLSRAGHTVVLAEDGIQAVELFSKENPDLVFLDVIMPNMDGIEAAKEIKARAGDELIPVIFLTSLVDTKSLVMCLESGGDDFLSKPYNPIVLEAKIKSFARMREMNQTMIHQKNQIEKNNKQLIQEQNVAKQVFDKIAHNGTLDLPVIRHYMSAMAVFNGDILLADLSPTGSLVAILGDFTGHGLPAAIGSMPLASIFHGMVCKGFSLADIMREINGKLYQTLPVGLFCCATGIDINFNQNRALIWTGGLPDGAIFRGEQKSYEPVKSTNLPLGVLPNRDFKAEPKRYEVSPGDHLLLWSDGILEARDKRGEMFGEERLEEILSSQTNPANAFDVVLKQVLDHIGEGESDDDVTLVDLEVPNEELAAKIFNSGPKPRGQLADWTMTLTLGASSLKTFDPMPLLVGITSEVPGLRQHSSVLYTVLSELFNNALEHGVLGLESSIKSSVQGFTEYYNLRKERLSELADAEISVEFIHDMLDSGGVLKIRMKDSGRGFIPKNRVDVEQGADKPNYFGRGLTLIESICESVTIVDPGNVIEVCFRWEYDQ